MTLGDEGTVAAWYDGEREAMSLHAGIGPAGLLLGRAAAFLGRLDEAVEHFEPEIDTWRPAIPYWAMLGYECARVRATRAAPGDKERASELVSEVLDVAGRKGLLGIQEKALALKLELQGASSTYSQTSIDTIAAAVQTEHPNLSPHAAPDGTVTLMFSDIIDSTATNERLGDAVWMALLREHNAIIREHIAANNGYEVKSMGDGFMLAFKSAKDGLNCAIGIQRGIAARNDSAAEPVEVRIGLHTGEAVQERGDFFGKHVNLAARIGGSATGGEILVSSLLAQLVGPSGDFTMSKRPAMSLKGLDGEHVTHAVEWR